MAGTDCGNDEKQKQSRTTLQEQRVIKECITVNLMLPDLAIPRSCSFAPYSTFAIMFIFNIQEALWYRSIPLGTLAMATSFYLVRAGKLKANKRFGAVPKMLVSAFCAYWFGKLSYIVSDSCQDKFLKSVPNSEIAYHIRKERGLPQPWTAIRDFGPDSDKNRSDTLQHNDLGEESDKSMKVQVPLGDSAIGVINKKDLVLSKKEEKILEDCNDCAFYYFSIPLAFVCGSSFYGAQAKGWLKPSDRKLVGNLGKLPKTCLGLALGYLLGQIVYLNTSDCSKRFLNEAPNGEVAKYLRRQMHVDEADSNNGTSQLEHKDEDRQAHYWSEAVKIDPDEQSSYITNYKDMRHVKWLEESKIEIPDKFKK